MGSIVRVLEGQEGRKDNDFKTFPVINIETGDRNPLRNLRPSQKNVFSPIEIVIENLDRCSPEPTCRFFGDCNDHRWVWFTNHVALFAFPLEFVTDSTNRISAD